MAFLVKQSDFMYTLYCFCKIDLKIVLSLFKCGHSLSDVKWRAESNATTSASWIGLVVEIFSKTCVFGEKGVFLPLKRTVSARQQHLVQSDSGTTCRIHAYKFSESYTGREPVVLSQLHFPRSKKDLKWRPFSPKFNFFPIFAKKSLYMKHF